MTFESIWNQYERELSNFVLSRVRDKEIQKEIMQEIALKIFISLHLQKSHLRGWLYTLTKNTMNDYYQKEHKPLPTFEDVLEIEDHLLLECLTPMLKSLKEEEQEILSLIQLQGYSLKDVAKEKKVPINTIKSQLYRAKKSLAGNFFSCCEYQRNEQGEVVDFHSTHCSC